MSRQPYLCPKCGKAIRRMSMSGGSVVYQGLPVPDPEDFCITVYPCRCTSGKGEASFAPFLNAWKQAYGIPDLGPPARAPVMPQFTATPAIARTA